MWKTALIPVSYTHLDVYKRQAYTESVYSVAVSKSATVKEVSVASNVASSVLPLSLIHI